MAGSPVEQCEQNGDVPLGNGVSPKDGLAFGVSVHTAIALMWSYGVAWVRQDAEAIARLFTKDAPYVERPGPGWTHEGVRAIKHYWRIHVKKQSAIRYRLLDGPGDVLWDPVARCAILKFQAQFASGTRGVAVQNEWLATVRLSETGKISHFEEYWHPLDRWDDSDWRSAAQRLADHRSLALPPHDVRDLRAGLRVQERDAAAVICGCGLPRSWQEVVRGDMVAPAPIPHELCQKGQKQRSCFGPEAGNRKDAALQEAYDILLGELHRRGGRAPLRLLCDSNASLRKVLAEAVQRRGLLNLLRSCPDGRFVVWEETQGRKDWMVRISEASAGNAGACGAATTSAAAVAASAAALSSTAAYELLTTVRSKLSHKPGSISRSILWALKDGQVMRRLRHCAVVDPRWHDGANGASNAESGHQSEWEGRLRLLARLLCEGARRHQLVVEPPLTGDELQAASIDDLCKISVSLSADATPAQNPCGAVATHGPGAWDAMCARALELVLARGGSCAAADLGSDPTLRRCWREAGVQVGPRRSLASVLAQMNHLEVTCEANGVCWVRTIAPEAANTSGAAGARAAALPHPEPTSWELPIVVGKPAPCCIAEAACQGGEALCETGDSHVGSGD